MPEWSEILVILVVATVVFGPHRLPAMARKAGKMMAEFRAAARELREGIERELAVDEMREVAKDVMATTKEAGQQARESLTESDKALRAPPPLASPGDTAPGTERQNRAPEPAPDPENAPSSPHPPDPDSDSHPNPDLSDRSGQADQPS